MTTSLTNTLLSKYMLEWAMIGLPIKYSLRVEGDDSIIGFTFD